MTGKPKPVVHSYSIKLSTIDRVEGSLCSIPDIRVSGGLYQLGQGGNTALGRADQDTVGNWIRLAALMYARFHRAPAAYSCTPAEFCDPKSATRGRMAPAAAIFTWLT